MDGKLFVVLWSTGPGETGLMERKYEFWAPNPAG